MGEVPCVRICEKLRVEVPRANLRDFGPPPEGRSEALRKHVDVVPDRSCPRRVAVRGNPHFKRAYGPLISSQLPMDAGRADVSFGGMGAIVPPAGIAILKLGAVRFRHYQPTLSTQVGFARPSKYRGSRFVEARLDKRGARLRMSWARIEKAVSRARIRTAKANNQPPPPGKPDDFNAYMQRLVQLIPAEIVALYLTFHAAANPNGSFARS